MPPEGVPEIVGKLPVEAQDAWAVAHQAALDEGMEPLEARDMAWYAVVEAIMAMLPAEDAEEDAPVEDVTEESLRITARQHVRRFKQMLAKKAGKPNRMGGDTTSTTPSEFQEAMGKWTRQ